MLNVKVVTPTQTLYDGTVDSISVPTTTGVITVLNKHAPIVSTINGGELTIVKGKEVKTFMVFRGVINVRPHRDGLTDAAVLLEYTEDVHAIDEESAREALKRAEDLRNQEHDDALFLESQIERELNRVRIARKYKK